MPNNDPHHSLLLERFATESGGESDFPPIRIHRHTDSPDEEPPRSSGMLRHQDSGGEMQPPPYTQACLSRRVPAISGSSTGVQRNSNNENQRPQAPAFQPQPRHLRQGNAPRAMFGGTITNTLAPNPPQVSFTAF